MTLTLGIVCLVIAVALVFDFTNGFHDAANAIATIVATGTLSLGAALAMAACFNVLGTFLTTAVATTVETGILRTVGDPLTSQLIVLAALFGAISWNVGTWLLAMPSSSSHALIGGLVGAGLAYGRTSHEIIIPAVVNKVIVPMFVSPVLGALIAAGLVMLAGAMAGILARDPSGGILKKLHLAAGALMAVSYASNDAQKTMGVITLALVGAQYLPEHSPVPWWVIILCAAAMAVGTLCGGRRIIATAGQRITLLNQEKGFAANAGASLTILLCTRLGFPVATTQVVIGAITGAGLAGKPHQVDGRVWKNMLLTWALTLPGSAIVAMCAYSALAAICLRA